MNDGTGMGSGWWREIDWDKFSVNHATSEIRFGIKGNRGAYQGFSFEELERRIPDGIMRPSQLRRIQVVTGLFTSAWSDANLQAKAAGVDFSKFKVSETGDSVAFVKYAPGGRQGMVSFSIAEIKTLKREVPTRYYQEIRDAAKKAEIEYARRPKTGTEAREAMEKPFGEHVFIDKQEESATFMKDGKETTVNMEMVEKIVDELHRAGVIGYGYRAALDYVFEHKRLPLPPRPKVLTTDEALTMILETIRHDPDTLKSAGEWITKVTNGITAITREEDER
jgi:hypothetical protein